MKKGSGGHDGITPLMRQYNKIKEQYPDKILFFRMGDFYEMFGDDAVKAAPILNVALTSRGHMNGARIPLAGVPYHAMDKYLARLLEAGEKVVVVEQVEDPKLAKGVVKREVVEIITPGTATIDGVADIASPLYLGGIYQDNDASAAGIAYIDLLSGKFYLDEGTSEKMIEKLRVLSPQEIIFPSGESVPDLIEVLKRSGERRLTPFDGWNFDYQTAVRELTAFFGVGTLDGFGVAPFHRGLTAAGAIYRYLREANRNHLDHVTKITVAASDDYMALDYSTVRNLELVKNLSESTEKDSLFSAVNLTLTAGGARLLKENILHPFCRPEPILHRQKGVKELFLQREISLRLPPLLRKFPDLERLAGRLGMRKLNPRQLASLREGLLVADELMTIVRDLRSPVFQDMVQSYPATMELSRLIEKALTDEPPLVSNKGNVIRAGYSAELDNLKDSIKSARVFIASLQQKERERTGIPSLKVGYNQVFGYYIEITRTHLEKTPSDYIRKQTLVNAERFITQELKEKEELIAAAEEKIFALEERLYNELVENAAESLKDIIAVAEIISEFDLIAALADLASARMYCCPDIDENTALEIIGGRHPVIENILPAGNFIANDLSLAADTDRIMILTGPNMSGKSTYLRQIGLIVILAQIGSFVPAESARIGLVDRVFTRVGAIDNLARGQSTFLVEMIETSNILHNATEKSLLLLDEVGRGTSTFDGLSIAWAVVEFINENIRARTVFATHYHELTGLAALYDRVRNYQVSVKRWEDTIIFLHKIIPGGCDDSYGIEVARLAGVPRSIVGRSRELLHLLESGKFSQSELARGIHKNMNQRSLFDSPPSPVEEELREMNIDSLTPLEALRILSEMKRKLDDK
ncbi:DNA mismatch repair protein MutS [Candidatus Zixiibacteriota bacterium]|nr:DNA mismatch repair protein MutS [candidate division Zixibacteria bacterium]